MQHILHPLKHSGVGNVATRVLAAATTTSIGAVPHLSVGGLGCLREPNHIHEVKQLLEREGMVKLSLGFPDDESRYLHGLIVGLNRFHGHGLPVDHSATRGWFWDIRPSATQFQSNGCQARSETMREFPWHTDCSYEDRPPRYFALQVIQPDRCGGGVFSALAARHIVHILSPAARDALRRPDFSIAVPPEFMRSSNRTHVVGSILSSVSPEASIRFREDIVTPLSEAAAKAMDELKKALRSPEARRQTLHLTPEMLPRGSVLLLDNRRWLHARNEVRDPARHLRRVRWDALPFV
ncbi:hypothetical protein VTH82DRAFT_3953 [Thermothelomyces myriococcoides]